MKWCQTSVTVEYPFGGETWVPGETENIRWSAYGGDPNGFTLEYSTDGGSSWNLINNTIPVTARSFSWTVPEYCHEQGADPDYPECSRLFGSKRLSRLPF